MFPLSPKLTKRGAVLLVVTVRVVEADWLVVGLAGGGHHHRRRARRRRGRCIKPRTGNSPYRGIAAATPFTYQVTAPLAVPVTLAVNCTLVPVGVEASRGATVTAAFTGAAVIVTIAAP